ncbi:MAG TPA: spore coat polysaccharide biosynthesis protein F [Marinobacter sp.]|uniref:MobA-like NTP transferase domain-containing protein n=1 Tax=marine sediment metagenome TaxID=412755 RepID=A0A0F9R7H5_9ZZZZ|nr:spore coat polysaccharide biosynthesis protein F [Marinobacter sp.]
MTTVVIVQARLTSTRLPAKMMLSLGGEPCIRHVLRRAKEIPGIDKVVCATPVSNSAPIWREAMALGVKVVQGSEHDVLGRFRKAALLVNADIVMRITGDCPLIDPEICGRVLELMEDGVDYASNVMPRGFPKGLDCECFTMEALERAHKEADDPYDREHVTPFIQRMMYCVNLDGDDDPNLNWCLDTLQDYLFLSERFA